MKLTNTIDCNGLSPAPTILRIKQALTGREKSKLPLHFVVDSGCDQARLMSSLGKLARHVRFIARPA